MQLTHYSSKVKTFNKTDLLKEVGVQRGFIESLNNTLRLLNTESIDLKDVSEKWAITKSILDKGFRQHSFQTDLIDGIVVVLPVLRSGLDAVEKVIKGESDNIVDGSTLTIRQANCLMFMEYNDYFVDYAINMIEVLLSMKLSNKSAESSSVPKADLLKLNKSAPLFQDIFMQLYADKGDIAKRILNGADVPVDDTAIDVLSKGKGENSLKSFATRNAGIHYFLPMYWIKSLKANYDLYRIRNMREANEMAAMKIEQLANRQQNNNDPKLDRQIQTYQDQIIKNRAKIDEIIESYEQD